MPLKWVAFAVTIWIGGVVLGLLMEGEDLFGSEAASLASVASLPDDLWSLTAWTTFLSGLLDIFTLNFNIFKGEWQIVRILLLAPIIITIMYGIIITVGSFLTSLFRPG